MPGDDRRKIEKAATLGVDCICMDMEDGVALTRKTEARAVIAQAMKELDFGNSERCIRINSFGSGFEKFDLAAAVATNPDTIVVPKVETAEQIRSISEYIEMYERSSKVETGTIRMLVGVETARGILNLKEIAEADKRLEAIIFGAEDFAASVGATRTRAGTCRTITVICARAVSARTTSAVRPTAFAVIRPSAATLATAGSFTTKLRTACVMALL